MTSRSFGSGALARMAALVVTGASYGCAPVAAPPLPSPAAPAPAPPAPAPPAPEAAPLASAPAPTATAAAAPAPAEDEYDALARKLVEAKTHVAYSPSAHTVASLHCIDQEGTGSECTLVSFDASVREDHYATGLLLWEIGKDSPEEQRKALPKAAAELRAKKYVGLPRVAWEHARKPLDVPGIGAFSVQGDTLRSPRPKGPPLETPLEKMQAPHKNRPTAVFAAPEVPYAVVEIERDPGAGYTAGYNSSTYTRVVALGPSTVEPAPTPEKAVEQGKSYFAVYFEVGKQGDAVLKKAFNAAKAKSLSPSTGELRCDQGAAEALGLKPEDQKYATAVYFTAEADARRFADLLRPKAVGLAKVTRGCAR